MIKAFYKCTMPRKIFFNKDIQTRSLAYGEDVRQDLIAWQTYYNKSCARFGNAFRLSVDRRLGGEPFDPGARETAATELPTLSFATGKLTVAPGGQVLINDRPCALNVGTECKAWGIASIPHGDGTKNTLFVIGKPVGHTKFMLAAYPIEDGLPGATPELLREFPPTLETCSYLVCLGRHVFTVHDAKLDYFYYNFEQKELEHVAIGRDGNNADHPWCQYVAPSVICDQRGNVYWRTDSDVYTFCAGAPRTLSSLSTKATEQLVYIQCTDDVLLVYRRRKSTGVVQCTRYAPTPQGLQELPDAPTARPSPYRY